MFQPHHFFDFRLFSFSSQTCAQPNLQQYQARNQPSYIHQKNKERIEAEKAKSDEPEPKKFRRATSVEPLDRPELVSPLPELPEDLQVWDL